MKATRSSRARGPAAGSARPADGADDRHGPTRDPADGSARPVDGADDSHGAARWRTPRGALRLVSLLVATWVLFVTATSHAAISLGVAPVWKESRVGWGGWNVIAVTITNPGAAAVKGRVEIECQGCRSGNDEGPISTAPFIVQAAAAVVVRVPTVHVTGHALKVRAVGDGGVTLAETELPVSPAQSPLLVEMSPPRIGPALANATITVIPAERWGTMDPRQLFVGLVERDLVTGDPVLPERVAEYAPVTALVLPSDVLSRVSGLELEALTSWVLGGGTLAVAVKRPEDLRSPVVVALVGGEPHATQGAPHLRSLASREVQGGGPPAGIPAPPPPAYDGDEETAPGTKPPPPRALPPAKLVTPTTKTIDAFVSYAGGSLVLSDFGSTAAYGLGEVHLLPFDPTLGGVCDDPWVSSRLVELTRHAWDRRVAHLVPPGLLRQTGVSPVLAAHLDALHQSRWTLVASMLVLVSHAIVAGPVLFGIMKRQARPIRILIFLPVASTVTFALVLLIGLLGRGRSGEARHLSLLEAGGGMQKGVIRRYRSFLYPDAREVGVRSLEHAGAPIAALRDRTGLVTVERAGLRVVGLQSRPWETVVAREDGTATLGEGIALVREGTEVRVTNRTGRALRGVIVHVPGGAYVHFERIGDRESVVTGLGGTKLTTSPSMATGATTAAVARELGADAFEEAWAKEPGFTDAVRALQTELQEARATDAWPDDVPALFAQLDGGEGITRDGGLQVTSDRLFVRVLGFGGAP